MDGAGHHLCCLRVFRATQVPGERIGIWPYGRHFLLHHNRLDLAAHCCGTRIVRDGEEITVERLERALAVCAYLVMLDGPVIVSLFERLERDLAAMRGNEAAVIRAKELLGNRANSGFIASEFKSEKVG